MTAAELAVVAVTCVKEVIKQRTLSIWGISVFLEILAMSFIFLFFCFYTVKMQSYVVSDEGIGFIRFIRGYEYYSYYAKWEDITAIEYKRPVFTFGVKELIIHSSEYTYKNKKFLAINGLQRDFEEIVSIVSEKTGLAP